MTKEEITTQLSIEQCWDMLREQEFGRLAFHMADEVHIIPVNYLVDQHTLLIRTAEGSKLLGVVMNPDVAFEIDEVADDVARSVVLRGTARRLEEDEAHRADDLPLPWVDTMKFNVIEVTPEHVTGREFALRRTRRPERADLG